MAYNQTFTHTHARAQTTSNLAPPTKSCRRTCLAASYRLRRDRVRPMTATNPLTPVVSSPRKAPDHPRRVDSFIIRPGRAGVAPQTLWQCFDGSPVRSNLSLKIRDNSCIAVPQLNISDPFFDYTSACRGGRAAAHRLYPNVALFSTMQRPLFVIAAVLLIVAAPCHAQLQQLNSALESSAKTYAQQVASYTLAFKTSVQVHLRGSLCSGRCGRRVTYN